MYMRGPKRAYIKFPGIGLCRCKIVLDTAMRVVIEHWTSCALSIQCQALFCTCRDQYLEIWCKLFWDLSYTSNVMCSMCQLIITTATSFWNAWYGVKKLSMQVQALCCTCSDQYLEIWCKLFWVLPYTSNLVCSMCWLIITTTVSF